VCWVSLRSTQPKGLYGRYELLDQLWAYNVRPAEDQPPHKFEIGTKNHEGLAGTTAAINYVSDGTDFYLLEGSKDCCCCGSAK
jgi:hypothetical protein